MLVLPKRGIYDYSTGMAYVALSVRTKFHEDWYRRSSNIKVCPGNVRGRNVGITEIYDVRR
jgi:hypothetical protein